MTAPWMRPFRAGKFASESRYCEDYDTYLFCSLLYKTPFFEISCAHFKILLSFFGNIRFLANLLFMREKKVWTKVAL